MTSLDPPSNDRAGARRVLVLGGTGFVGRSLCRQLTSGPTAFGRVTVATRHAEAAAHLRDLPGLQVAELDVFDPARLAASVERHDAVVNLVAILHGDAATFRRVHVELVETLASACQASGRSGANHRVIHVSALGVGSGAPSAYLRSKTDGEARLQRDGIDATILRPSVIVGAHDRFLNLFARLLRFAPALPLACAHARFQPVWVEDVAAGIVRCLGAPPTRAPVYECVGPTVYELIDLVRLAGAWSGHRRPVFALPDLLGQWQAALLEHLPGDTLMSRDNLDSMRTPNVASGLLPTLKDLGGAAAALEQVAPQYLKAAHAA